MEIFLNFSLMLKMFFLIPNSEEEDDTIAWKEEDSDSSIEIILVKETS